MALIFLDNARYYHDYRYFVERFNWNPGTLPDAPEHLLYHCFWSGTFSSHQKLSLESLLVTQSPPYEVWIWMQHEDIVRNRDFICLFEHLPWMKFKPYNPKIEAIGTAYERNMEVLEQGSSCISDGFRLLVLKKYGGIYFDLDVLFLRDLRSLCTVEFFYQWSNRPYGNTAVFRLFTRSFNAEALIERAIDIGCTHPSKLLNFEEISRTVSDVYVFPSFLFDPAWISTDTGQCINTYCNHVEDFFTAKHSIGLKDFFPGSYAYHWHNQWNSPITDNTIAGNLCNEVTASFERQFGLAAVKGGKPVA